MISIDEIRSITPDPKALISEDTINELIAEIDEKMRTEAFNGKRRVCSRQVKQAVGEILVDRYKANGYTAKILGNHTVEISW